MAKRHDILVEDPHLTSHAALILLRDKLSKEVIAEYLEFRLKFLGGFPELTCSHCGVTDLLVETDNTDLLATVDHKTPLSKGGALLDPDNCVVACYPCNNNRKNMGMEEFRRRKRQ